MSDVELLSCAKVNLGLALLDKRPDGYHELETLMHEVDIADKIGLSEANKTELYLDGIPWEESLGINSILEAKRLFEEALGYSSGHWRIEVTKQIPMGSGMGGGSSNAIAMLLFLYKKYVDKVSYAQVDEVAARLGSDTNFFLKGGTAVCRGRGEQVEQLCDRELYFNLIFPPFSCSTPKVFSEVGYGDLGGGVDWDGLLRRLGQDKTRNDLEPACIKAYCEMKDMIFLIRSKIPQLSLSGSGSTLFTLHEKKAERDSVYLSLLDMGLKAKVQKAQSYLRA